MHGAGRPKIPRRDILASGASLDYVRAGVANIVLWGRFWPPPIYQASAWASAFLASSSAFEPGVQDQG